MSDRPVMLVVGAAPSSLGEAIYIEAFTNYDFSAVHTAGIGEEQIKMDVTHSLRVKEVLQEVQPDIVVCTVGANVPASIDDPWLMTKLSDSFMTNVTGVMTVLGQFLGSTLRDGREGKVKKFIAVSSNSAHIPRTRSLPYCASKAALSMALRVAARELGPAGQTMVWGYEPGLLAGTPMTRETEAQFGVGSAPGQFRMHRMKGVAPEGIPVTDLAARIVYDAATFTPAMNGLMVPFDAGEI